MKKQADLNQEKLRKRLIEVYEDYLKKKNLASAKEIVKEYDDVRELLDETLNCALGILEAISKKEIKDKNEEKKLIDDILKEMKAKSYLGGRDLK